MSTVVPSQQRQVDSKGGFMGFYDPPQYRQTDDLPRLVSRGVLGISFLDLGDRFLGCTEPEHIRDVLLVEGGFDRPSVDEEDMEGKDEKWCEAYVGRIEGWAADFDRRRKSARERVKKRRQRAG